MTPDKIGALIGVFGGLLGGGLGWYLGRRAAAKQRGLDERYHLIQRAAKAAAWQVTLAAMIVMYVVIILGSPVRPIVVLSVLYLIHLASWTVGIFYYNKRF